jgi:hypothetical protein
MEQVHVTKPALATYQNPVIAWHNEAHPAALPETDPPPDPFQVTRSEIVIRTEAATVHIWYALIPAVRA